MLTASQEPIPNGLLASLPAVDRAHLASLSRVERPAQGLMLRENGETSGDVWFPHTGLVALTTTDELGRAVQTGLIGREGCVGAEALFAPGPLLPDAVVQIAGAFSVMPASRLAIALLERPAISTVLLGFLCSFSMQSMQTIACNHMHGLDARCCRWLLTMQDRSARTELPVTQENLAMLLGSGRPRVNQVLAGLEKQGLIQRHRGCIHVLNRCGLKQMACECYGITQ